MIPPSAFGLERAQPHMMGSCGGRNGLYIPDGMFNSCQCTVGDKGQDSDP